MRYELSPCRKCGRPALIGDGPGNSWQIGCFRDDCDCEPVGYLDGDDDDRASAVSEWNGRHNVEEK